MTFISSNYVDYGCGNTCIGVSNYPGYELYKYSRVVNTPTLCDSWEFSVNIPERNLVDYNDNFGANLAIYCRINNSLGNYDSPTINGANVVIGCTDYSAEAQFTVQPFLPTSIICTPTPSLLPVGECSYNSIGYSNGLSFSNPFPSTGYNVNPDNGQVTFTPIALGTTYFAILVRSYDGANLVGEILVEGMIIISNCLQSSMVNISPLNNNLFSGTFVSFPVNCFQTTVVSQNGSPITDISVFPTTPIDISYEEISPVQFLVTFCLNRESEDQNSLCEDQNYPVILNVQTESTTDCLGQSNNLPGLASQLFTFFRPKVDGCVENIVITNINTNSTNLSTSLYKAQDRIWVGDDFPAGITTDLPGPVEIAHEITFIAGLEVVNPSCVGGGAGCVTLTGSVTQVVIPNHCSIHCIEPIEKICTKPIFGCNEESIEVEVLGGTPPFTVYVFVNDVLADFQFDIYHDVATFNIHDIVSSFNGNITYHVVAVDVGGNKQTTDPFPLNGTKRFYNPIADNMVIGEFGNPVFARNPEVTSGLPALFYDIVNDEPPYYGITSYSLEVYNRWGELIYDNAQELSDGKWSFDNGEIYWNGFVDNNPNLPCDVFTQFNPTRIRATNCFSAFVYQDCLIDVFESAASNFDPDYPCGENTNFLQHVQNLFGANFSTGGGILTQGVCYTNGIPWNPNGYVYPFEPYQNKPIVYKHVGVYDDKNCHEFGRSMQNFDENETKNKPIAENPYSVLYENHSIIQLAIHPNPTNGLIQITGDVERITQFVITDLQAKIMKNYNFDNKTFDLQLFESGTYFLSVWFDDGRTQTFRLIKI